jgi:phage shock protein A
MERLSTLIRANINDMLDQAEDPEIMLSQILRDMESEIGKARSQVADMMAQERLFSDDLKAEQEKASHMQERAEHYVRQGNDAMAREALKRKSDSDANTAVLQQQLSAQSEMVSRLRSQLDTLNEKYQNALSNRDNLLARYHRAKAQQQITRTMSDLDVTDYSGQLSRMEQRIRTTEARSDADRQLQGDLSQDTGSMFDDTERNADIDNQLAALKAKMGGGGETPSKTTNLGK